MKDKLLFNIIGVDYSPLCSMNFSESVDFFKRHSLPIFIDKSSTEFSKELLEFGLHDY